MIQTKYTKLTKHEIKMPEGVLLLNICLFGSSTIGINFFVEDMKNVNTWGRILTNITYQVREYIKRNNLENKIKTLHFNTFDKRKIYLFKLYIKKNKLFSGNIIHK